MMKIAVLLCIGFVALAAAQPDPVDKMYKGWYTFTSEAINGDRSQGDLYLGNNGECFRRSMVAYNGGNAFTEAKHWFCHYEVFSGSIGIVWRGLFGATYASLGAFVKPQGSDAKFVFMLTSPFGHKRDAEDTEVVPEVTEKAEETKEERAIASASFKVQAESMIKEMFAAKFHTPAAYEAGIAEPAPASTEARSHDFLGNDKLWATGVAYKVQHHVKVDNRRRLDSFWSTYAQSFTTDFDNSSDE
jgi:hypothetical protein